MLTIDARPESMPIEPSRTAVIVVDMQNDFGAESGMFSRAGIDISAIRGVVGPIRRVLTAARGSGVQVVYLKMAFQPDLCDAGPPDTPTWLKHLRLGVGDPVTAPDGSESRVLVRDTWNTDIVDELAPEPGDIVLYKHRYSGFYETDLDSELRRLGIQSLIFTGCTTSVCVESTLRDAMFRDYHCLLLEDCTAEPVGNDLPRTNHDASLLVVQAVFGRTARSDDLVAALAPQIPPGLGDRNGSVTNTLSSRTQSQRPRRSLRALRPGVNEVERNPQIRSPAEIGARPWRSPNARRSGWLLSRTPRCVSRRSFPKPRLPLRVSRRKVEVRAPWLLRDGGEQFLIG